MTKIDIVSGFLGAGKTTLIKKMLSEAYQGEKLVLIENEFGEISIDGGFLKDSGVQISEMSSGCICCSLVGDFNKALRQVHEQFAPDRILIEPSGVGKLSDVIVAVENTVRDEPDMKLNSFVTVADATKVKVYMKNFGEFYNNQIESAGTIILSRTQKLSQEKLEAAVALLREKNPTAAILTTPWDQLDGKTLLSAVEKVSLADELLARMQAEHEAEEAEHHHHHHDHDEHDDHDKHEHHHDHDEDEGHCCCGHHHDDDDDDEDGGEATLSEQNLYRRLSEYYDLLEDLDSQVRGCAQNFNGNYLEEDRTTRQNLADVAERTEDTIEQYYDIVEDLDVPTSSKNYSSWKDIIALYDDLDHRIDAICDAWEISLKYAKPADHKNEIVAPLSRDNVAGTNDNKYRLDFEERYPGAKPVEVN